VFGGGRGGWNLKRIGPKRSQLDPLPFFFIQRQLEQFAVVSKRESSSLGDPLGFISRGNKLIEGGRVEGGRRGGSCGAGPGGGIGGGWSAHRVVIVLVV
jgi:hypothetical protein